jgi:hypothetical protein
MVIEKSWILCPLRDWKNIWKQTKEQFAVYLNKTDFKNFGLTGLDHSPMADGGVFV